MKSHTQHNAHTQVRTYTHKHTHSHRHSTIRARTHTRARAPMLNIVREGNINAVVYYYLNCCHSAIIIVFFFLLLLLFDHYVYFSSQLWRKRSVPIPLSACNVRINYKPNSAVPTSVAVQNALCKSCFHSFSHIRLERSGSVGITESIS